MLIEDKSRLAYRMSWLKSRNDTKNPVYSHSKISVMFRPSRTLAPTKPAYTPYGLVKCVVRLLEGEQ